MKVAIVHEYLTALGGAEKVMFSILNLFPDADIYTSIYNPKAIKVPAKNKVYVSFLQKLPFAQTKRQLYLALMPKAFESFDFSGYDLVISDSHSFAKGIRVPKNIMHICYCHTPTRYLWLDTQKHIEESRYNPLVKKIIPALVEGLKEWDLAASKKPTRLLANSCIVQKRIQKIYNRKSTVIYPPIETHLYKIAKSKDYYLAMGRFEPYKKFDLIVRAFNENGKKLYIIGSGTEGGKLKKMARSNIKFLGAITDKRKIKYVEQAKAFVFPQEEDFGIVALEAQAAGVPVIAYNKGGARETVVEGKTGVMFNAQTVASLNKAVEKFEKTSFDKKYIKKHAQAFSQKRFEKEFKEYIKKSIKMWKQLRGY